MTGMPVALTIAGSDSGGGAGVVADAKAFTAVGVWATVAITAVTAQNTLGVQRAVLLDPAVVTAQIDSVCSDMPVAAVKTGMLGSGPIVAAVVEAVVRYRLTALVVDPVAVSTSGTGLLDTAGLARLADELVPRAALVTPNMAEAAALTGLEVADRPGMEAAGTALLDRGCRAVLVTGGHLPGRLAADCLVRPGADPVWLETRRVHGPGAHGTGCVLSAAICAGMALGLDVETACRQAKAFVAASIRAAVSPGAGPPSVSPRAASPGFRR